MVQTETLADNENHRGGLFKALRRLNLTIDIPQDLDVGVGPLEREERIAQTRERVELRQGIAALASCRMVVSHLCIGKHPDQGQQQRGQGHRQFLCQFAGQPHHSPNSDAHRRYNQQDIPETEIGREESLRLLGRSL